MATKDPYFTDLSLTCAKKTKKKNQLTLCTINNFEKHKTVGHIAQPKSGDLY